MHIIKGGLQRCLCVFVVVIYVVMPPAEDLHSISIYSVCFSLHVCGVLTETICPNDLHVWLVVCLLSRPILMPHNCTPHTHTHIIHIGGDRNSICRLHNSLSNNNYSTQITTILIWIIHSESIVSFAGTAILQLSEFAYMQ